MSDVLDLGFVQSDASRKEVVDLLSAKLEEQGVYITDER